MRHQRQPSGGFQPNYRFDQLSERSAPATDLLDFDMRAFTIVVGPELAASMPRIFAPPLCLLCGLPVKAGDEIPDAPYPIRHEKCMDAPTPSPSMATASERNGS